LTAVIRVMDQLGVWITAGKGHHEGVDDEIGGLAFAHRPAAHASIVEIDDAGPEQLAVNAFELGDVGHPSQI